MNIWKTLRHTVITLSIKTPKKAQIPLVPYNTTMIAAIPIKPKGERADVPPNINFHCSACLFQRYYPFSSEYGSFCYCQTLQ